jgi:hypothetical protein
MKITRHFVKPRNPLVAACLQRRADRHKPSP